jgi:adenylate cyclase, class 2
VSGGGGARTREEIEVKLPASDLAAVRERLVRAGSTLASARHDESNDLYDDADRRLSGGGRTVRVRRAAGRAILTYKGAARFEAGARMREERETDVSDPAETEAILRALGLEPRFRYEKRREEWRSGGCLVALDETPIGDFVEIEGAPDEIRKLIVELGLDPSEAIPYSYPELYARRRREDPALPADMVWTPR